MSYCRKRSPRTWVRAQMLLLALSLLSFTTVAHAMKPFTVKEIKVEGLQRIAVGTVFNYLPISINDRVTDEKVQDSIRALFKTGYFKDVQLQRQGSTLVVRVVERPSIASITIKGSKKFPEDELKKHLKVVIL